MSARHKARKRALDLLYEADIRQLNPINLLSERGIGEISEGEYVRTLIRGIDEHKNRIDELIIAYAEGWDLDRIPNVDRNILRIGIFELLWGDGIPSEVAIAEALELATELGAEDSVKYINGLLARILVVKPSLGLS